MTTKMVAVKKAQKSVSKEGNTKNALKQKVLLPTLKEQQRYVVYSVVLSKNDSSKASILSRDFSNVHNDILSQCNSTLGIFDGAKAGLQSVKFNPSKLKGILRVDSKYVDKLKICFGLIKSINGIETIVDCVYVSGMVNKAVERMDA
jgi:RNase P/RNase MRP subunit POP5